MKEIWDLFDKDRNLLSEKQERNKPIKHGCYHQVASIWIKNNNGEYLMSKRHPRKAYGGLWECTGGSIITGETSLEGAVREVQEELGIKLEPKEGKLVYSVRREEMQDFYDAWLFNYDVDISNLILQESEVTKAKWINRSELDHMWSKEKIHPLLAYYKNLLPH
ncbi:NUDIX domain-containing protein [Clostridium sp. Marseille-Q2269]|uniref:NUDIX hydrolase n=1 Tax=Clostridium sp. Marseille-Q2269 TaxID=2942205 RepID=UPI0020742FB0|nr:NUDIX domain-containing protein [Clostridium sp. Marseille-Q2269]